MPPSGSASASRKAGPPPKVGIDSGYADTGSVRSVYVTAENTKVLPDALQAP